MLDAVAKPVEKPSLILDLTRSDVLVGVLLVLVMLAGGYFRFVGLNWDDFTHWHPDERFLTDVVSSLNGPLIFTGLEQDQAAQQQTCAARYPDTNGRGGWFDALCSPMNPHNTNHGLYVYGTLPAFLVRWTADFLSQMTGDASWAGYYMAQLVGRMLSAIAESGVVLVVFFIGVRLHDKWVGLLAALLYACAVFSIQQAHFWTVDAMSNLFVALAILCAVQVQDMGGIGSYLGFGLFFGAAMASRINTVPVVGLLLLAAGLRLLPILDGRLNWDERQRMIGSTMIGLAMAGLVSFLVFRVTNPYAFNGPGFFGLSFNPRWLADAGQAQYLVSGAAESPPNWQWVGRTPYLFPLSNMVLWGMGIGLGLTGVLAWLWSGWRLVRGRAGALRNVLPFVWILVYFGWLGKLWVMTMRYYLPLYPVFAVLAAWGLLELVRRAYRSQVAWRKLTAVGLVTLISLFTVLWAAMFTNIYRHLFTPVQSSHWVEENLPADFSMQVEGSDSPLMNVVVGNNSPLGYQAGQPATTSFVAPADGTIDSIHAGHLGDSNDTPDPETIQFTITDPDTGDILGEGTLTADLTRQQDPLGRAYDIPLDAPMTVTAGKTYTFTVYVVTGGFIVSDGSFTMSVNTLKAPLINIAVINRPGGDDVPLEMKASRYEDGQSYVVAFTAPADGVITHVFSPHLGDPNDDPGLESIQVQIGAPDSNIILADGTLTADLKRDKSVMGDPYDIPLSEPVTVKKGLSYSFTVKVLSGGPVISAGPVFAWEGEWDEVSLPKVCPLPNGLTLADDPPPGLVSLHDCNGQDLWSAQVHDQKLQIFYEEEPYKQTLMQQSLDNSDYLIISTNRRYDSQSRIPYRWPMTMRFYDALFNGKLGFELVKTFQETFELGPLKVSDQYLPTYSNSPQWLNEFEAEEAFTVYDHPVVFIFRKTSAYSSANTQTILDSVSLNKIDSAVTHYDCPQLAQDSPIDFYCDPTLVGVMPLYSVPASAAPTMLQFPPDIAKVQTNGGTWSDRFHSESIINTQPIVTILAWWFAIMVFGWVTWPLLFVLFPGLADRGYSFAKVAGLLLVAWLAWFVSSARIPMWSQTGIAAALLVVAALSAVMGWRRRAELSAFVRENGRRMAWIEVITLLAFVIFLVIRLTNPDLWHPSFGGEKPMDFAYFNGVLRSTVFPPIDPWHSGGYINYYYFGYVIVGAPVLLLGVMPSIAYNLIIPTLFALTGMGAFSVAFNIVSTLKERRHSVPIPSPEDDYGFSSPSVTSPEAHRSKSLGDRLGNPWVAGVAALILAVGLGNLDTPRVFVSEGLMKTGAYQQPLYIQNDLIQDYTAQHGQPPVGDDMNQIVQQANDIANSPLQSALYGLKKVISGQPLNLAPNRWYWAPTRVIMEAPDGGGNAIAEFPFFTFLYGDLHAHMISMPLLFVVMIFVVNEVLLAGDDPRSRTTSFLTLALGALVVGMLRATNTWDWVTFMALSLLGLSFAWWLRWAKASHRRVKEWTSAPDDAPRDFSVTLLGSVRERFTRRSIVNLIARLGTFSILSAVFSLPYTTWYASVYGRALPWTGPKTQLWMYFSIHGTFLFLIVSLLAWDTGRWLRTVYVRSLRGTWLLLIGLFLSMLFIMLAAAALAIGGYPVTIVVVPLLVWIAVLFLRDGQSREMRIVLALTGLALALTLAVEYVVLDGDVGRQNTLFKFYIQAWLLFSAVGGVAVACLVQSSGYWRAVIRIPWYAVAGLFLAVAALYPIMASRGRSLDRLAAVPLTLDGMEYMKYATLFDGDPTLLQSDPSLAPFPMVDDYNMIRWMQENIQGTPTIMEGRSSGEYHWEARVSILTGLPSVNGWNFHQRQQRTFDPLPRLVEQRVANINAFYVTTNIDTAWDILRHYDVSYVVMGDLEHAFYPADGLAKFDEMVSEGKLEVVYEEGKSVVYKVHKDSQFDLVEDVAGGI
jgi:YYY domain-containing protein